MSSTVVLVRSLVLLLPGVGGDLIFLDGHFRKNRGFHGRVVDKQRVLYGGRFLVEGQQVDYRLLLPVHVPPIRDLHVSGLGVECERSNVEHCEHSVSEPFEDTMCFRT